MEELKPPKTIIEELFETSLELRNAQIKLNFARQVIGNLKETIASLENYLGDNKNANSRS